MVEGLRVLVHDGSCGSCREKNALKKWNKKERDKREEKRENNEKEETLNANLQSSQRKPSDGSSSRSGFANWPTPQSTLRFSHGHNAPVRPHSQTRHNICSPAISLLSTICLQRQHFSTHGALMPTVVPATE